MGLVLGIGSGLFALIILWIVGLILCVVFSKVSSLRFATVCLFCLWSVKRSVNSLNLIRALLNRIIKRVVFTSIFSMQIYEH